VGQGVLPRLQSRDAPFLGGFSESYGAYAAAHPGALPAAATVAWPGGAWLWFVTVALTVLFLTLLFSTGQPPSPRPPRWWSASAGRRGGAPAAEAAWTTASRTWSTTSPIAAVPLAIGVAILRYRLYDIDRIINRTVVDGLVTVVLALGYGLGVLVLGQLLGRDRPSRAVAGATLGWRRCSSRPAGSRGPSTGG